MPKNMIPILAAAALLTLSTVAAAHPGGGPPGGTPGRPSTIPGQGIPHNPNGTPPVGAATNAPDTDRGHSEGKGHTDSRPGKPTIGRVASFSGTTLMLRLPNGTVKTFTVDAHAFGQLNPHKGAAVAVFSTAGTKLPTVVRADQRISAVVTGVSKDLVTIKLPNGDTRTISVASEAAANMQLAPGLDVLFVTHDGGFTGKIATRH